MGCLMGGGGGEGHSRVRTLGDMTDVRCVAPVASCQLLYLLR